jgi:predicted GNAT family acetyltransferase
MDEAIKRGGNFNVARQDASNIFGAGSERVRYTDPESGGTIEVVARPDGSASVLELEVPESSRGQGIGQKLQERVMQDFPEMGGQVSSKAAAKTAYRLGRRPPGKPDATLEEVFADIDEMSSVNMVSPAMQERFAPPVRNVQDIEGTLQAKYPDVKLSISGSTERGYTLNKIDVPKDKRESGIGTAVMNDLVTLADQQGAVLKLSPSGDFGGSVPRLKDFYERFGFVQNKGKNTDYAISESMYRSPALIPPSQWESLVVGK